MIHPRPCVITRQCSILLFLLLVGVEVSAQPLHFSRAAVVGHHVGSLAWNAVPDAITYRLYREYPSQLQYHLVAIVADTQYLDTLHRVICSDTVSYYLVAELVTDTLCSDTVGLFYQDNIPTAAPSLRLCSVDTLARQIVLSWYPSPDTDVMGYYICMGSPCRDYDTVWGRLNTSYRCLEPLNDSTRLSFRILAFDSCHQASSLTDYYYNPVLYLSSEPCSRQLHCSWTPYVNMPDSVAAYRLFYRLNDDSWHCHTVNSQGPFQFDTLLDDLAVSRVTAYLCVSNTPDSLHAYSLVKQFDFQYGDTARYLRVSQPQLVDGLCLSDPFGPSIALVVEVDTLFTGSQILLYRAVGDDGPFSLLDDLQRPLDPPAATLGFTDCDISRTAGSYRYFAAASDVCQQRYVYSDTVQLLLPHFDDPAAYFPNAIIYGDPVRGAFCPLFVSSLSVGYSLSIFNRWGECLFHSTDPESCWRGAALDGSPLQQGVYVYRAHCHFADGSEHTYVGTIFLIH